MRPTAIYIDTETTGLKSEDRICELMLVCTKERLAYLLSIQRVRLHLARALKHHVELARVLRRVRLGSVRIVTCSSPSQWR